jgi:heme-degrading monooxygenase HmoA
MLSASFIFRPGIYDEDFHRLNDSIDAYAHSLSGFIGVDRWFSEDKKTKNSIYYWADRESLDQFAKFPDHLEAKSQYSRWYDGYQIVISEVKASYGDGKIPHITNQS